jgi:FlaA1/EpsC-like NDP-sugar epimerase
MVLVEQAENNLFEIDRDLQRSFPDVPRATYVADICDAPRVDHILKTEEPALLFHAAAHKHVPMMEINVGEAVKNNILGTKTIANAAKKHRVHRFVMISTDKAVNPTSVMGCTKRVAEMYIQQLRQGEITQFMTVRFGNVLGSSGSVVPIFARQIAAGGPVTVTDPRMTRYFMTIPEASQLVLQAGVMGKDGDIFVLDMGEPVKIVDLAREMITLSGLRPGEDIEIQFTGIRPGEKLYEELSVTGANMGPTTHETIYVWRNKQEAWDRICRAMDELVTLADELDPDQLRGRLTDIVPEGSLGDTAISTPQTHTASADTPSEAPSPSRKPDHPTLPYGESPAV